MGNTSVRTEGQLTPSGLGDEVAELDDDGTHVLDVLCARRLVGTGRRGPARAGTSVGNAGALIGRHAARRRVRRRRRCRRWVRGSSRWSLLRRSRRRRLRLARRGLLIRRRRLGLGLFSGGRRRGLGRRWLWLRVGTTVVEPPLGVENAVVFARKVVEQATREIEFSVPAGRALVRDNSPSLLAVVRDGDLFTTDSRWVNGVASKLGTVDSDNLEIQEMNSRAPDTKHGPLT